MLGIYALWGIDYDLIYGILTSVDVVNLVYSLSHILMTPLYV